MIDDAEKRKRQIIATDKWQKANLDRIVIKMRKDNTIALDEYMRANNITSRQGFIIDLINAAIGYNDK